MSVSLENLRPEDFAKRVAQEVTASGLHDPGILACVQLNIVHEDGKPYQLVFVNRHPSGPFIRIDTPPREQFLTRGSEEATEEALKQVAHAVLGQTGGQFDIHAFYGAVWGTAQSTVAKDFGTDSPFDNLSMILDLSNAVGFDQRLTEEAQVIGPVFTIPGDKANRFLKYSEGLERVNPNQKHRDISIINDLGEKWDAEFKRYNPQGPVTPIMELSPRNISDLTEELPRLGLTPVAIPYVYIDEWDKE